MSTLIDKSKNSSDLRTEEDVFAVFFVFQDRNSYGHFFIKWSYYSFHQVQEQLSCTQILIRMLLLLAGA